MWAIAIVVWAGHLMAAAEVHLRGGIVGGSIDDTICIGFLFRRSVGSGGGAVKDVSSTISASVGLGNCGASAITVTAAAFAVCSTLANRTSTAASLKCRLRKHVAAYLNFRSMSPNFLSENCEASMHNCAQQCKHFPANAQNRCVNFASGQKATLRETLWGICEKVSWSARA